MQRKHGGARHHSLWLGLGTAGPVFLAYLMVIFLVTLGDAIMSYSVPVYIESFVESPLLMGAILSFSSLVGIACDMLFAKWFGGKSFKFFFVWTLVLAFVFPAVIIFLPPIAIFFLLAMAAWGIYYELLVFSHFHFVGVVVQRENHALAWGLLESMRSAAYFVGPILAAYFIDRHVQAPFFGTIGFLSAGAVGFLIFLKANRQRFSRKSEVAVVERSTLSELKIWFTLLKRVWPLFLFLFTLGLVDATFWSVGTLLSEELRSISIMGGFMLSVYTLPSLFVASSAGLVARPFGKKRAALLAAVVASFLLMMVGLVSSVVATVLLVFCFALFFSLTFPEIYATFEDYVERLEEFGNDMIGLESSAVSLSYIIGPLLAGSVAAIFGNRGSFVVAGALLLIVSLICLLVIPRKIKMPKAQLEQLKTTF